MTTESRGFSLTDLLIVLGIISLLTAIAAPWLVSAIERSRQRRTMSDMRMMAAASSAYCLDHAVYADALARLQREPEGGPAYLPELPERDAWGTPFIYLSNGSSYALKSLGADRMAGPPAPVNWVGAPYDPDLQMVDGIFTQAPTGTDLAAGR